MARRLYTTLITIAVTNCILCHAQLHFKVYNEIDGLPGEIIIGATEDKYGFIWFATADGMARFDGYEFNIFKDDPADSSSISSSYINNVYCSPEGTLYAATEKGLNEYDYKNESFKLITAKNDTSGTLSNSRIRCLVEDNGILWIGTLDGLLRYDKANSYLNHFKLVPDTVDKWANEIRCINIDSLGYLWLGTFDGLYRFNPKDNSFMRFEARRKEKYDPYNNLINCIYFDKDSPSRIYVGSSNGLVVLDMDTPGNIITSVREKDGLSDDDVQGISRYDSEHLVIATAAGLSIYNTSTGEVSVHYASRTDKTSIPDNFLRSVFRDSRDLIWLCSDRGVAMLDTHQRNIDFHALPYDIAGAGTKVNDILDDDGIIWLSTNDGVLKLSENGNRDNYIKKYGLEHGLSHPIVKCIYKDSRGIIWVGTNDGLDYYDKTTDRFKKLEFPEDDMILKYIYDIKEDSSGRIITNISSGLCFISPLLSGTQGELSATYDTLSVSGLTGTGYCDINYISVDQFGYVWFSSTNYGLFRYDPDSGNVCNYMTDPDDSNSIPSNKIPTIYPAPSGKVWFGTDRGICAYDYSTNSFTRFSEHDITGTVKSIYVDKEDRLWILYRNKLVMVNRENFQDKMIWDIYDDLKIMGVTYNSISEDNEGNIYFGCYDGFLKINPDEIVDTQAAQPLYITSFSLFHKKIMPDADNRKLMPESIILTDRLQLKHNENSFSFSFSLMNYSSAKNNTYKYILDGYDKEWTWLNGGQNTASYSKIPPGRYTFRVQACNPYKEWSEKEAAVAIRIKAPLWASWWAITIYGIISVMLATVVYRFVRERIKLSAELSYQIIERERVELLNNKKMQFFTNISHEFKTPLSLISGPVDCLMDEIKDEKHLEHLRIIKQNSDRLKNLIVEILDIRRLDNGKLILNKETGDFVFFAKNIFDSFQYAAKKRNIYFEFNSSEKDIIFSFDSGMMEKVLYNLLSNAFKYTPDEGHISMSINMIHSSDTDCCLYVEVQDTGNGIPDDDAPHIFDRFYQGSNATFGMTPGTGIGLALSKDYIELHGGTISFRSKAGEGSTFYFNIPLTEKADFPAETEPAEDFSRDNLEKDKVLVIEDNADMQKFIMINLKSDYNIFLASDGVSGLEKIKNINPDIVITDIMMPGMSGYELCRYCKEDLVLSDIPIIMLTARSDESSRAEGYDSGADAYLYKPFNMKTLKSRINALIKRRQALQERFKKDFLVSSEAPVSGTQGSRFITQIVQAIEENISNPDFGIEELCDKTNYSYQQIYRKVKSLTGESISEFIRTVRLKRAARLLSSGDPDVRVSEVLYSVGFNTHSYFTKCFKEMYGMSPKEYLEKYGKPGGDNSGK